MSSDDEKTTAQGRASTRTTADNRLQDLIAKLESSIRELYDSDKYRHYLDTMAKFNNYSARNIMLLQNQNPDATYVATYNTWQREHGRQVNRGEKAMYIIAPRTKTVWPDGASDNAQTPQDSTSSVNADNNNAPLTYTYFRAMAVFDVSQTSGRDFPKITNKLTDQLFDDASPLNASTKEAFFDALKVVSPAPIYIENLGGTLNGYYHLEDKRIMINAGMGAAQTIKTTIHEVAHAIMHDMDRGLMPTDDAKTKEIEAESVAYVVCQYFGFDTSDFSLGYIASWSGHDKELVQFQKALDNIQKASNSIIKNISSEFEKICNERGIDLPGADSQRKDGHDLNTSHLGSDISRDGNAVHADKETAPQKEKNNGTDAVHDVHDEELEEAMARPTTRILIKPKKSPVDWVTDEQVEKARGVSVLDYLRATEPENIQQISPSEYRKIDHDSFKIFMGKDGSWGWKWHSRGFGGKDAIDYLKMVEGLMFQDAVRRLCNDSRPAHPLNGLSSGSQAFGGLTSKNLMNSHVANGDDKAQQHTIPGIAMPGGGNNPDAIFELPAAYWNQNKVKGFLQNVRGIDADVVQRCIDSGVLKQTEKYSNCLFIGLDEKGEARFASVRGLQKPGETAYRGKIKNSDTQYGFYIPVVQQNQKAATELFVFESPIEAMSKATLDKAHPAAGHLWNAVHRLSLDGVSDKPLHKYLENNPQITKIVLCLNNDHTAEQNAGQIAAEKIIETIESRYQSKYKVVNKLPGTGTDWNDALMEYKRINRGGGENKNQDAETKKHDSEERGPDNDLDTTE